MGWSMVLVQFLKELEKSRDVMGGCWLVTRAGGIRWRKGTINHCPMSYVASSKGASVAQCDVVQSSLVLRMEMDLANLIADAADIVNPLTTGHSRSYIKRLQKVRGLLLKAVGLQKVSNKC